MTLIGSRQGIAMAEIYTQVDRIIKHWQLPWTRQGAMVEVSFGQGGRHQRVYFEAREHSIHFRSIAAPSRHVKQSNTYWRELALRVWRKNASKDLIAFAFDKRDRLVGCAEHPGTSLTNRDLRTYIEVVARECDQMEFLLTGEDRA